MVVVGVVVVVVVAVAVVVVVVVAVAVVVVVGVGVGVAVAVVVGVGVGVVVAVVVGVNMINDQSENICRHQEVDKFTGRCIICKKLILPPPLTPISPSKEYDEQASINIQLHGRIQRLENAVNAIVKTDTINKIAEFNNQFKIVIREDGTQYHNLTPGTYGCTKIEEIKEDK